MKFRTAIIVFVMGLCSSAHAEGFSSSAILKDCAHNEVACKMYFAGAADTYHLAKKRNGIPLNCIPENYSFDEKVADFLRKAGGFQGKGNDQAMMNGLAAFMVLADLWFDPATNKVAPVHPNPTCQAS